MKHYFLKNRLLKACLLIVFCLTAFLGTAKAGLDYYEIYIGKKLIFKRAVNEPLNLAALPISKANINEQLVIYYYQCNAPAKLASKRIITLKDRNGNKVKEWKFADAGESNKGMSIPVKELVQLQKAGKDNSLDLFYSAEGKRGAEKLASLGAESKTVGYMQRQKMSWDDFRIMPTNILLFYVDLKSIN